VDVNTYEVNGLFGWGRGRARGYFGIGAGAMTLDPSTPSIGLFDTSTRFAANVALGGKFYVSDNLAVRLDARYRWRVTPSRVSTVLCGETGCHTSTTNLYSGAEVTAGLTYRFGEPAPADR
jgi:opacity protein-like surface antigen